jgi:hypothetical protein
LVILYKRQIIVYFLNDNDYYLDWPINHEIDMNKQAEANDISSFLCPKHKQAFINKPEYAEVIWTRLINEAQNRVGLYEWNKAVIIYGNAFEISDILLKESNDNNAIKRYLRSAIEFAYVLRQCSYTSDVAILYSFVRETLTQHLYPAETKLILQPLKKIAFSTLHEPKNWIDILKYMSESYSKTLH